MKKMLIALFVFVLTMMITNVEVFGQTDGRVTVDSVNAQRGDKIAVGVRVENNNNDISALSVPIRYNTTALILDSVSFLNSIKTSDFTGLVDSFSYADIAKITYIPSNFNVQPLPYLNSPNGLIATLFFTVRNDAPPGDFSIDSVFEVNQIGGQNQLINVQFSNPDGDSTYFPEFRSGNVAVLVPTDVDDDINSALPTDFALAQNYPNPFNPTTIIGFSLPVASEVKLEVFNVLGQKVETLASGRFSAGQHSFEFDASDHPSGIFFYRLTHESGVETKKMILIK